MRIIFILLICLLIVPIAFACDNTKAFSFCKNSTNDVCDTGEFIFKDSDCSLSSEEMLNLDFAGTGWFIKLLTLALLILGLKAGLFNDWRIVALLGILFVAFMVIPSHEYVPNDYELIQNKSNVLNTNTLDEEQDVFSESTLEKPINWVTELPGKLFPSNLFIGGLVVFVILAIMLGAFEGIADRVGKNFK